MVFAIHGHEQMLSWDTNSLPENLACLESQTIGPKRFFILYWTYINHVIDEQSYTYTSNGN